MSDISIAYEWIWKAVIALLAFIIRREIRREKEWRKRIETDIEQLKERMPRQSGEERRVYEGLDSIRRHVRRLTDK